MKDLDNQPPSLENNVAKKRRKQAQAEKDKLDIAMDTCKFPLTEVTLTFECEYDEDDYTDISDGIKVLG